MSSSSANPSNPFVSLPIHDSSTMSEDSKDVLDSSGEAKVDESSANEVSIKHTNTYCPSPKAMKS